ncbi:2-(5''-triphosphoribosyl)-3'-dephosphocoenzyme-A synthase [bioreactor metagenome]|uniref:2-(5''-triphosphoribosyl)-3'-dephosphocoenzyme-A synthase n=1 Tax=bioreactor metagenome TaxID=1076179 RepID=A0A645HPP5_9ZZZZ
MARVEDSTVVYRHDINTLRKVQSDAKEILNMGGVFTLEGKQRCHELEDLYIKEHISPGGCADLLAISILLIGVKKIYF